MDIEELRRKAMASMPHKKKQKQQQQQQQQSDPQSGKSHANNLFDTNVVQTTVISCALSPASVSGSLKERDVVLSSLQDLHQSAISPSEEEKDDNLVIRFSDGESDSDAEENHLKMDERHGDVSFRGNIIGSSANHSPAASSQMVTSASQHAPGMWNQMAMMRKQLAAMRTSMSSAIQVRGAASGASADGSTWKSSMQKRFIGQKSSVGQKRGVKPGASVTKPSGSNLHNLRRQIPTKGGTDLEKLRKQITNKDFTNLEDLRKQIATKENELKLQRHMKSGGRPGMLSAPNGKVHPPEIGESTSGSPSRQMCNSSASPNLEGTSDKETGEDKQKVLHVTVQEPPDLKFTKNSLQQQRRNTSNASINYNLAKDADIDSNPVTNLYLAGQKRPHTEDNPAAHKCLKITDVIDGNEVVNFQSNSDSVQKLCTSPSRWVMPDDLHLANINCFPEREGIKKRKTDGPSPESGSDIHLANCQFSAHYIPDHQRQFSVGGFPNKGSIENVKVISREGEKVKPEIKKTRGQFLKESVQMTDIQSSSQKIKLGSEQPSVNCWTNAKEEKDGSSVQPFIKEGCSYLTYGGQPVERACGNKSIFDTSGDIPRVEQMTGGSMFFTSRELVQWQGNRDPQSNIRPIGLHIEGDLLQSGKTSLQYLIKEEEAVVKELEEAREHRSRCELEEKLAWEAYRKVQTAVQAINERCADLHEKRQRLSTQMHAVALRTYSSQESPGQAVGRKEDFYEPQSFSGHKNLSNVVEVTPFLKDHLEASEQPRCKLNECSFIVDNVINSSLQPCIGNNLSSSKYGFQSVEHNSDGRLTGTDVIVNTANRLCMDNKNLDIGKIYGSVDSGVTVNRNQDIDSREPGLLIETSVQRNEMEEKCPVSRELTFKVSEGFQSHQLQISDNMEPCNISEYGLIREQNLIDSVVDTNVENDENYKLLPKSSITPVSLADENQPAVQKSGGPSFQQVTCLSQKRKLSNQIVVSECSADGPAKISDPSVSKLNLGMDLFSLKEKTKEEGSGSPGAETNAESLHDQNNTEESNIQLPGKIEEFAHAFPQSQEVPEEIVKTTALGHLTGDDVHENSGVRCHSENSHASGTENWKTNNKSFTANFSSSISKKVIFEENNKEKCHSGSCIDEGCAIEKENMAVWKNLVQELATSDNSVPGGSVASDVAYIENQDSMQHIGSAYSDQNKILGEIFAQGKCLAVSTKYYKEASNQPLESNKLMSSELKVVFSHVKAILTNNHAIMGDPSGKMTQVMLQDIPEHLPMFLLYESPLNMFKSYNIYSNLIASDGAPDKSITCSHVVNPFWPLCKFEHRGKCNNEECPWQHARDYSLSSPQFAEHLKKYCNSEMDSSTGKCKTHGKQDSNVCFELQTKEVINRGFNFYFAASTRNSALPGGFSCRVISNNGVAVPVYRIGPHLIKADAPMVGALIARSTWRFWKLGFCQSFSIPFAIQRLLLPDMACLYSVAVREWMLGNNSRLPTCLYSSSVNPDDTKAWKHLFRGLENVECWLELAIDSMNFDSNIDKMDGRKKALCVLSRAIEANPNSVALWVVYLHIFYRKEKVIGKDDMFYHAVQYNKGSYELWLLFINSRLQMDQRLEAYQNAISVLCSKACASEMQDKSSSPYVLDLVLQMLNFLSLSGHKQKAMTWIDDLSCSTEGFNKDEQSEFNNAFSVLSCLTKKDACVLWVSCTYYRVYGELPEAILGQLEFEQKLPFNVEWHSCDISETEIACTLKLMDNAVSNLNAHHDHSSQLWRNNDNSIQPVHAVVINHVKCVLAIEGLASARKLCLQYRQLYLSCIELFLISSSIDSHCGDDRAGIDFFDNSLCNWPEGIPGIQRFWNQYVGYVLESKGADSAKNIIDKWYFYMEQHKMLDRIIFFRDIDYLTCSPLGHAVGKQEVEEYKNTKEKTHDFFSETGVNRSWCQDVMFALLNLAIYRFLNNDPKKAQFAADQALKVAFDYGDVKQCIKECAALALFSVPDELEPTKNGFDTRMLQLFDKCFLRSQLFPHPKPLSRAFTDSIKKPKIRIFIENLLGPIPVDFSLLNSILEVWHGPSLLPEHFGAFKDLVDFIEGLLELAPANLKLVLSISRMVVQKCNSQSISSVAAHFWASSLLINSIFQSFPVAPEKVWLEVTKFLELLDVDIILEEFYQQALSIHPFSVALWHSFHNFRQRSNNLAGVVETAKQRGIIID